MLNAAYVVWCVNILTFFLSTSSLLWLSWGVMPFGTWKTNSSPSVRARKFTVSCLLFGCQSVILGLISHTGLPCYSSSFSYCSFYLPAFVVEYPFWPIVSGRELFVLHNQSTLFSTTVATLGKRGVTIVPGARDANWQDAEYTIILMTLSCEIRSQQLHTYTHYYCNHSYLRPYYNCSRTHQISQYVQSLSQLHPYSYIGMPIPMPVVSVECKLLFVWCKTCVHSCTRAPNQTVPCATCEWLLHPGPTSA